MKITVATLVFGDLPYFPLTQELNNNYCRRHGYPFEIIRFCQDQARAPVWGKE